MTRASKTTAAFYLTLVFIAGAGFGFASSQFYTSHVAKADEKTPISAAQYRKSLVASLDRDLDLDERQIAQIMQILDEVGERWYQVRDAMEPEFEAIRQERIQRIMAVLSPEQRADYQKILDERQAGRDEEDRRYRYGK